jgi:hypothetical protein
MCGDPPLAKAQKREGEPRERAARGSGDASTSAALAKAEPIGAGANPSGGSGAPGACTLLSLHGIGFPRYTNLLQA